MARLLAALALVLLASGLAAAQLPLAPPENPLAGDVLVHRNSDVEAALKAIAARMPELATVETAGQTTTGQPLWTITFRHPDAEPPWRVYLDGGHHGNEYMGVELVMAYVQRLAEGWAAEDPEVVGFLRDHAVKALPLVNPEGNALDTRKNARQVDLNRNYPYEWGGEGSGGQPSDLNYRGEAPLSEPESAANLAAGEAFAPHAWVSMHTGIAEMYWPWSYTQEPPPDSEMFLRIEKPFEDAGNGRLDAMQSAELYLAAGSIEDTIYGQLGIPGFVIEVHEDQFTPAYPGGIPVEVEEQLASLHWLMANSSRLGALLEVGDVTVQGAEARAVVRNVGFGAAVNATLTLVQRGVPVRTFTGVGVPAGGEVTVAFDGVRGADGLRVEGTYRRLLVASSPTWELSHDVPAPATVSAGPLAAAPGIEAALLALAAAGAARVARRRS